MAAITWTPREVVECYHGGTALSISIYFNIATETPSRAMTGSWCVPRLRSTTEPNPHPSHFQTRNYSTRQVLNDPVFQISIPIRLMTNDANVKTDRQVVL
jgi:hypothetical protein